jgi:hypothetical protein
MHFWALAPNGCMGLLIFVLFLEMVLEIKTQTPLTRPPTATDKLKLHQRALSPPAPLALVCCIAFAFESQNIMKNLLYICIGYIYIYSLQ